MNRDKFIKLLKMTTSTHDGEALNAIRMVNSMLQSHRLEWDDLIVDPDKVQRAPPQNTNVSHWKKRVEELLRFGHKYTDWEYDFLTNLSESTWSTLTPRQNTALEKIWKKYNADDWANV